MRRLLLLFLTLCGLNATTVRAGEATTDHFTMSDLQEDDGYTFFTVSLSGSRIYTAYNLDIVLPDGVTPLFDEGIIQIYLSDDGPYPTTGVGKNKRMLHNIAAAWETAGKQTIRIVCNSTANDELEDNSGELFYLYVNVSPYAKAGANAVKFTMCNLIQREGARQFDPADSEHSLTIGGERSLSLNISATNKWSTCVLPFDAAMPAGVKAYSCGSTKDSYLVLSEATNMAAYTPYILYAENGYTGTLTGTADGSKYAATAVAGLLSGAVVAQEITSGYVLQNQDGEVMFYNVGGQSFTIPEGRCWLSAPDASRAAFAFGDGDVTAISSTKGDAPLSGDIYELDGRRAASPQTGRIYIVGGQKMLKLK